jgi:hypothetical protein
MIRALTLAALVFLVATTSTSALESDAGYPTPSEVAAEQAEDYSEDFTDSGVGCADDCLELEAFTDPATVPDEYTMEGGDTSE